MEPRASADDDASQIGQELNLTSSHRSLGGFLDDLI